MKAAKNGRIGPKQENGCPTSAAPVLMDEKVTLRLPERMKAAWQAAADRQGIDLGEFIRQTMQGRRARPASAVRVDDRKHLSRMALWTVGWLERAGTLLAHSNLDAERAQHLQVVLETLLELFAAVANGEIEEEPCNEEADASGRDAK
jgi:hypothetical protein